jgi:hypothetical protein
MCRIVKFLLCIVFIAGTAGYSACPSTISDQLIMVKMNGKNCLCTAYSHSTLEECLEDIVDLKKVIDDLFRDSFGDSVRMVESYTELNGVKHTGFAVFIDDYVFVQFFVHVFRLPSTLNFFSPEYFCADISGVYNYNCYVDNMDVFICSQSLQVGKSSSGWKKGFPVWKSMNPLWK